MKRQLLALAACGMFAVSTQAATIDFTGLGDDVVAPSTFSLGGATFTSSQLFYANANDYFDGQGGSICGYTGAGCTAAFRIDFGSAVTGLSFQSLTGSNGRYIVNAYDAADMELASLDRRDITVWDFSSVAPPIAYLTFTASPFDNRSGLAFGNFNFVTAEVPSAVSEPGSLALFAGGLLGVGAASRRRRSQ